MTTFSDREKALEAHFASHQLALFGEQFARNRLLGLRLAVLAGLNDREADRFALAFADRCIRAPAEAKAYEQLADALTRQAPQPDAAIKYIDRVASESWVAFVTTELMSLFHAAEEPVADMHATGHTDIS